MYNEKVTSYITYMLDGTETTVNPYRVDRSLKGRALSLVRDYAEELARAAQITEMKDLTNFKRNLADAKARAEQAGASLEGIEQAVREGTEIGSRPIKKRVEYGQGTPLDTILFDLRGAATELRRVKKEFPTRPEFLKEYYAKVARLKQQAVDLGADREQLFMAIGTAEDPVIGSNPETNT